jgi:hypothetical protein
VVGVQEDAPDADFRQFRAEKRRPECVGACRSEK